MAHETLDETSAFRQGLLGALSEEKKRQNERRLALAEKARLESALLEEARSREDGAKAEKLDLARQIFRGIDGLRKDRELGEHFAALWNTGPEIYSKGLFINGWRWAHRPLAGGECNWSRTYLRESDGSPELYYWAGYKWMSTGPHIYTRTPEEMAARFSLDYLRQLKRSFDDGTVYEAIRNWHIGPGSRA